MATHQEILYPCIYYTFGKDATRDVILGRHITTLIVTWVVDKIEDKHLKDLETFMVIVRGVCSVENLYVHGARLNLQEEFSKEFCKLVFLPNLSTISLIDVKVVGGEWARRDTITIIGFNSHSPSVTVECGEGSQCNIINTTTTEEEAGAEFIFPMKFAMLRNLEIQNFQGNFRTLFDDSIFINLIDCSISDVMDPTAFAGHSLVIFSRLIRLSMARMSVEAFESFNLATGLEQLESLRLSRVNIRSGPSFWRFCFPRLISLVVDMVGRELFNKVATSTSTMPKLQYCNITSEWP